MRRQTIGLLLSVYTMKYRLRRILWLSDLIQCSHGMTYYYVSFVPICSAKSLIPSYSKSLNGHFWITLAHKYVACKIDARYSDRCPNSRRRSLVQMRYFFPPFQSTLTSRLYCRCQYILCVHTIHLWVQF